MKLLSNLFFLVWLYCLKNQLSGCVAIGAQWPLFLFPPNSTPPCFSLLMTFHTQGKFYKKKHILRRLFGAPNNLDPVGHFRTHGRLHWIKEAVQVAVVTALQAVSKCPGHPQGGPNSTTTITVSQLLLRKVSVNRKEDKDNDDNVDDDDNNHNNNNNIKSSDIIYAILTKL